MPMVHSNRHLHNKPTRTGRAGSMDRLLLSDHESQAEDSLTVDEILQNWVGEFGWGQLLHFLLLSWSWVIDSQHILSTIFADQQPSWRCKSPGQAEATSCSYALSVCEMDPSIWEWRVGSRGFSTVTEWGLFCGREYKAGLSGSIFFLGCIIGSGIFGRLSDSSLGRKRALLLACMSVAIAGSLAATAPNFWIYLFFRLLNGVARGGVGLCAVVLATEPMGPSARGQVGLAAFYFFAVGAGTLPIIAWFVQSWRLLYLAISVPSGIYCLLVLPFVSESPRWLLAQGRSKEAMDVLRHFARLNGKSVPEGVKLVNDKSSCSKEARARAAAAGIADVFRCRITRSRMWITLFIWFSSALVYYGISLNVGNLGFNMYISAALNGFAEAPSMFIAMLVIDKLGRRLLFTYASMVCGVCCVLVGFMFQGGFLSNVFILGNHERMLSTIRLVIEVLGMLGIAAALNLLYIYTAELFPTVVRNAALATNMQACQFGQVIAPFVVLLGHADPSYPFIAFSIVALISGVVALKLPETMDQPLQQTFEELEDSS